MRVHFIGIGGIGASSLAQYFIATGNDVSGSDLNSSEITEKLNDLGVKISIGHSAKNISKDIDLVIYSPAVNMSNPELKKANNLKIKNQSYPKALGEITKKYFTIAVSGTHGKSTTSSMITLILMNAGLDPTVIIGTKMKELNNGNFRMGKSKYLVIEADEYKESFLNYHPRMITLTNIEADHLDYYKNLDNILKAFSKYLNKIHPNGYIVANKEDENINKIIKKRKKIEYYSINQQEAQEIRKILKVPGEHNLYNALAAFETALMLGIKKSAILKGLSLYKGSWRRFEIFKGKEITLVSDYGHHPTEVKKTLEAAREKFPKKRIRCIFQPHQYERTFNLFNDFVRVLNGMPIDEMILSEIYTVAGREKESIKKKVNSKKLTDAVNNKKVIYKKTFNSIEKYIMETNEKDDVLIVMGAGDVYQLFLNLKEKLIDKKS